MSRREIMHGTVPGYMQHMRRDKEACADCRRAWAIYYRDRRRMIKTGEWKMKKRVKNIWKEVL